MRYMSIKNMAAEIIIMRPLFCLTEWLLMSKLLTCNFESGGMTIMIFVNRDMELSFLRRAWQEDKSQLVVIYGKRRVGKTALVKEFSKDQPHIYFLADKAPDRDQLRQLSEKVGLYFQDDFLLSRGFGTWYDFFKYIKSKEKFVMIFDEFPYLIESNPSIPSMFQKGWDDDLSESGIFLILLGSSMGMMETEVLGHKSPLFGRRTVQILV